MPAFLSVADIDQPASAYIAQRSRIERDFSFLTHDSGNVSWIVEAQEGRAEPTAPWLLACLRAMPSSEHKVTLRLTLHDEGETVAAEITGPVAPENGLQVFGDLVLLALEQHADNAAEAAGGLIGALRERAWEGDDVLADQLGALLATGAIPDLEPLPVSLDELAGVLEGDPAQGGGRIEVATGQVWPDPDFEYGSVLSEEEEDELEDPRKWLWVHCEGSRDGYRDMERFIETVSDPGRADRLDIAITGPGAFRRFKDVLARWPGELERWYAFSAERQHGRARAWLADAGYYVRKSAI